MAKELHLQIDIFSHFHIIEEMDSGLDPRPSPSVITFFPISEFSYKLIRFLLHSPVVKSDNEMGKFYNKIWNVPGGLDPIMSSVILFYCEFLVY